MGSVIRTGEFYYQHLNYAEKGRTSLSYPRKSETLGQHEHLSHPTVARSHHVKTNPPIWLRWREARIAQEQAGTTSILHHMPCPEHIPAVGRGDIHSAEGTLPGGYWDNFRQLYPCLRAGNTVMLVQDCHAVVRVYKGEHPSIHQGLIVRISSEEYPSHLLHSLHFI